MVTTIHHRRLPTTADVVAALNDWQTNAAPDAVPDPSDIPVLGYEYDPIGTACARVGTSDGRVALLNRDLIIRDRTSGWGHVGSLAHRAYDPTIFRDQISTRTLDPRMGEKIRHVCAAIGWIGAPAVVYDNGTNVPTLLTRHAWVDAADDARLLQVPAISLDEIMLWHGTATLTQAMSRHRPYPTEPADIIRALNAPTFDRPLPVEALTYFEITLPKIGNPLP